jgi:gluconolactonase
MLSTISRRPIFSLALPAACLCLASCKSSTPPPAPAASNGTNDIVTLPLQVERLDPAINALVPDGAQLERVATGFKWVEGPVWVSDSLYFAEIPSNSIRKWTPGQGVSIWLQPSGYKGTTPYGGPESGTNGMTLDAQGRLTVAGHAQRDVLRFESFDPTQAPTVLVDSYQGKRLNSPNDLVFAKNGDMYFTDPPYGLPGNVLDPKNPHKELDFQGVYRLTPKGELTLLTKEMTKPNGIALSPDEKTLYVGNSDPDKAIWMAFPINADGTLGKGKQLYDATADVKASPNKGLPDGMKVDKDGNIFATAVNGVYVFSPDGKLLGRIVTDDKTANCNWGDDGTVLYLATNDKLTRIKTTTKGLGW